MKNRRAFLASLAMAVPAVAVAGSNSKQDLSSGFKNCPRDITGPISHRFPQAVVVDQNKRKSWFYEELIHDKIVLVSFTSVKGEKHFPVVSNMVKVQNMIGDRLGKDVFMYTVSTDPHHDTPEALKKLADSHGANWQFLTGDPDDVREILNGWGIRGRINGLAWVGNERTGRWMSKASRQHALYIAEAVARLSTGKHHKPFLVDMHSV
jgi:protein SCO1